MKKYKILEDISCSQESINDVVNEIHSFGFGKLRKVLSNNYCKVLVDAADEIEKTKLKLIEKNHDSTKSLAESIKNGQTWHQIRDNKNEKRRWGILSHYKRWWIKPSLDYTKCGSSIYNKLNDDQKILLGFASRPPSHGSGRLKTLMNVNKLPDDYDTALTL